MKKRFMMILIAVILIATAITLTSCINNATDIIPNDIDVTGLPPDPGEEGKKTLQGIDSDNDGVRDDIQRYIALEVEDEATQAILTDYSMSVQKYMIPEGELEDIRDEIIADFSSEITSKCLFYVDSDNAYDIGMEMEKTILNTKERLLAAGRVYSLYNEKGSNPLSEEEIDAICKEYANN